MESSEKDQWRNFEDTRSRTHGSGKPSLLQRQASKRVARDKCHSSKQNRYFRIVRFDTINPHSHTIVMCKRTVNRVELVWLDRAELEQGGAVPEHAPGAGDGGRDP
jgi:hypothetical protein